MRFRLLLEVPAAQETNMNSERALQPVGYLTGAVGKNHVIEVKGIPRGGGPPDDSDPSDPCVATDYAEKQRKLVAAFNACGFDFAGSLCHGNLLMDLK